ncbi:unnamed protein product, partial [Cuscuta epithymum]
MSFMNDDPYLKSIAATYRSISSGDLILSRDSDFLVTRETKCVYIAQKEYATVDPSLVDVIGTDGQGGCVGVVIRNPKSGLICVAHMDLPEVIDNGLTQMLSSAIGQEIDEILDVETATGSIFPATFDITTYPDATVRKARLDAALYGEDMRLLETYDTISDKY